MKPNNKIILAKLELNTFILLENTNKEFNAKLKHCQDSNKNKKLSSFKDCARNYQEIMRLVEYNKKTNNISDLLQFYYLEASLGSIQSQLNDLPQVPSNEASLQDNDKKIEVLTNSLTHLTSQADYLKNQIKTKKLPSAFRKDSNELFKEIKNYFSSWNKTISQRRAAYHYNCAEVLIEKATSYDLKINLFETAISYLEFSAILYEIAGITKHADDTIEYQRKIENQLKTLKEIPKQLEKKILPTAKTIYAKSDKSHATVYFSKASSSLNFVATNQTKLSNIALLSNVSSALPAKRKNWGKSTDEEEPLSKKSNIAPQQIHSAKRTNLTDNEKISLEKSFPPLNKINVIIDILLKSEEEEEEIQKKVTEFKKTLTQAVINKDPFRFYGRLFFNLSQNLQVCSKESSNHTLLTQLSWLTLSQQLIDLIPHKNQKDSKDSSKINDIRETLLEKHKKNLNIISRQKRNEAYPTYESSDLQSRNLKALLIGEVFDYYYGLIAFNLFSAGTSFLDRIAEIINKQNFTVKFKKIEETINNVYKPVENLFYAKLLRELVKFHIWDKNLKWHNDTFLSENKQQLYKEYLRILAISEYFAEISGSIGHDFKNKIRQLANHIDQQCNAEQESTRVVSKYPSNAFFQLPKQTESVSAELLNKTLQEHFECLIENRAPSIRSETIYNHLLQFVQTHCEQEQANIGHTRVSAP